MLFTFVFGVDKDVIKVHYHRNLELLCQDFIDVALEYSRCISQSKRHYLVLEMAIVAPESRFSFIAFPDPHLMVGIGEIKLNKILSPS